MYFTQKHRKNSKIKEHQIHWAGKIMRGKTSGRYIGEYILQTQSV